MVLVLCGGRGLLLEAAGSPQSLVSPPVSVVSLC